MKINNVTLKLLVLNNKHY